MTGSFSSYVSWKAKDEDGVRVVTANVLQKPSVADLLAFLDREAPGIDLDDVSISGGHLKWERPATEDERRGRMEWKESAERRQEEWEKAALARFLDKYGLPDYYVSGE